MAAPESPRSTGEQALRERVSQLERDLAVARERLRHLQELDQIYTDFTHAVSHELRTPLTLISGYAQQLLLRWAATDADGTAAIPSTSADAAARLRSSTASGWISASAVAAANSARNGNSGSKLRSKRT